MSLLSSDSYKYFVYVSDKPTFGIENGGWKRR